MVKVLHLTLKRKWFDLIASGEKKEEYREIKRYWDKRLVGVHYDIIKFRNGYRKDSPFMYVKYNGLGINREFDGKLCFTLLLGKVLEVRY